MRRNWMAAMWALLGVALGARAADVPLPSALPGFGLSLDIRQSRTIGAAPGEVVADVGYALRMARSQFDDHGHVQDLKLNGEFVSQTIPCVVTYGVAPRLSAGLSTTLDNIQEEQVSLVNFAAGTTFGGMPLPTFTTAMFRFSGAGMGDLQANIQYALDAHPRRTQRLLTLDATLPSARADSRNPFDLPPGKGNADVTPSIVLAREVFPWRGFIKLGQEFDFSGRVTGSDGVRKIVRSGSGTNANAGLSYQFTPLLSIKSTFVAFTRTRRQENSQAVSASAQDGLEWRPGTDLQIGKISISLEGLIDLAGRNTLRTQGFFQYAEFHF